MVSSTLEKLARKREAEAAESQEPEVISEVSQPKVDEPIIPLTPHELDILLRQLARDGGEARTHELNSKLMLAPKPVYRPLYVEEEPRKKPRYNPYG